MHLQCRGGVAAPRHDRAFVAARPISAYAAPLTALGIEAAGVERLAIYLELLWRWSARLNLTGARGPETQVQVLVAPVLPLRPLLEAPILDIGSGNGSPGLVLALLEPGLATTLLEPRAKRWAFLREAARRCGRGDLVILKERHDQYRGPAARTVLLRALKLPAEAIRPLVAPGGQLLALGQSPSLGEGFAAEPAPFDGSRWRRTN